MSETWRDIPGWEGRYQVSDLGNVRSLPRKELYGRWGAGGERTIKGGLRKQNPTGRRGYLAFSAKDATGKAYSLKVHLCVLKAFVGPRSSPAHDGCHGDGDVTNNTLSNLRWDTKTANNADKKAHGTWQGGAKNPSAVLTEADVRAIKAQLGTRTLASLGSEFGVSLQMIHRIKKGQAWSHV